MRIQFCKYQINGLQNIKPELYILTSTFQICLIHQDDPERFFIPGGKLRLKNNDVKKRFDSIEDYKEYFEPLIQIESLAETLGEHSEFTLLSVDIKWLIGFSQITKQNETFGVLVLPYEFCKLKNINFNDEMNVIHNRMENMISEGTSSIGGDLLCLRCKPKHSENYWIGHGEVVQTGFWEKDEDVFKIVVFILTQPNYDLFLNCLEKNIYIVDVYMRSVVSKRQLEAVMSVGSHPFLKDVILGNQLFSHEIDDKIINEIREEIKCSGLTNFNKNQIKALQNAMNHKLSLVWGPPGTGKTYIGCIISYAYVFRNIIKQCNGVVLYCGPSNDCVNLVTLEMKRKFNTNCPKLLRIFGEHQELADFPLPGRFSKNHNPLTVEMQEVSLHFLIRQDNQKLRDHDKYFQNILNSSNSNKLSDSIRIDIQNAVLAYKEDLKNAKIEFIKQNQFEMVLCTTSVTASSIMDNFNITQIIIDEAGMCKEPETLIPISSAVSTVENVVLIGDHKQLRPIIKSKFAKKRGLGISLFERYRELKPDLVTMLNYQYRMHPSILEFPCTEFYGGKLKTGISHLWSGLGYEDMKNINYTHWNGIDYSKAKNHYECLLKQSNYDAIPNEAWVKRRKPYKCFNNYFTWFPERLVFIHVVGDEIIQSVKTETGNKKSRGNRAEVEAVGYIYEKIIRRITPPRYAPTLITVLTQYRLQQSLIENKCMGILSRNNMKLDPLVKTVICSQGSENDYIIFSTVRSIRNKKDINNNPTPGREQNDLGSITDPNQINVALTRAKKD